MIAEGKIDKETIIEYSTDEGESFIALVFHSDEKNITVSQSTWHSFLNTSFNGDIRDDYPMLKPNFGWPDDFKECSVGENQDCFQFMMDFSGKYNFQNPS